MLRTLFCFLLSVQPAAAQVLRVPVRVQAPAPTGISAAAGLDGPSSSLGAPSLGSALSGRASALSPVSGPSAGVSKAHAPLGPNPAVAPALSALPGGVIPGRATLNPHEARHSGASAPLEKKTSPTAALKKAARSSARLGETSGTSAKAGAGAQFGELPGTDAGPLNILVTASESNPYMKTGGLADVVDDTTRGLAARGHNVTLVLPKYDKSVERLPGARRIAGSYTVPVGDRLETVTLWQAVREGVEILFLENEELFERDGAYGHKGYDYQDNDERFIYHARAVLESVRFLDRKVDVVHVHDWQAGLIPAYLKLVYRRDPLFAAVRTVMTIHNIAYQGFFPAESLDKAGFDRRDFTMDKLEYHGHFSFLKAGLAFADAITTVSPTYAEQIQTPEFGNGLDGLLAHRAGDLTGIVNGIDTAAYNPRTDSKIAAHYGPNSVKDGKSANKAALQKKAGFRVDPETPLLGIASRLADQKGIDLVVSIMGWVVSQGAQLYIAGSGDPKLESAIDEMARRYPRNLFRHPFDTNIVHLLFAAGDLMLMPSRFEPCGMVQMFAQRYGALVVAAKTGGLADTIVDIGEDPVRGTGHFMREFSAAGLQEAVAKGLATVRDADALHAARAAAMARDSSWKDSIDGYLALYRKLIAGSKR